MEDIRQITALVILGIPFLLILASIRIAKEQERFAVFVLGRFFALKGPGLVISLPLIQRSVRLAIGEKGRFKGDGIAEFRGYGLPVTTDTSVGLNTPVRICSFSNAVVHVEPQAL
jgi:regulator of protease activity HflC (stomatin/prohibitin superfamily)